MGGAKRYPSIAILDGFRKRLNPSYELIVAENRDLILKAWHEHFAN